LRELQSSRLQNSVDVLSIDYYRLSLEKIFKCTCMLADIKDWPEMSEEYRKFFKNDLPSRSAFAGSGLALNAKVEIECWAIK